MEPAILSSECRLLRSMASPKSVSFHVYESGVSGKSRILSGLMSLCAIFYFCRSANTSMILELCSNIDAHVPRHLLFLIMPYKEQ